MTDDNAQGLAATVKIAGHPLHPLLVTLPIGFWVGTLIFDLGFVFTGDPFWARGALTVAMNSERNRSPYNEKQPEGR